MKSALLAEFVGTMLIVFVPCAYVGARGLAGENVSILEAAMVSGLVVTAMIYALGSISGAHFNPAVTIAFAATNHFPKAKVGPYLVAQFSGGIAGAAACIVPFGVGKGAHLPLVPSRVFPNFLCEASIAFLLMFVIVSVATNPKVHSMVPALAIGVTVICGVLIAGPVTGGSMNPARSFGPAIFAGPNAMGAVWLYLTAPVVGACAAAFGYELIRRSEPS
jgi:MIP family channel proteins